MVLVLEVVVVGVVVLSAYSGEDESSAFLAFGFKVGVAFGVSGCETCCCCCCCCCCWGIVLSCFA